MDTVFSDWKTALENLQKSVEKDLEEIRKQKAEIQQIKHDIFNRMAEGQYIRDDHRIVLSAPEIIIGNVDSTGMLWSETGSTIIIRGNGVKLEGSGSAGYRTTGVGSCQPVLYRAAQPVRRRGGHPALPRGRLCESQFAGWPDHYSRQSRDVCLFLAD